MNNDSISRSALKEEFKQYICSGCTFNIKDYPHKDMRGEKE